MKAIIFDFDGVIHDTFELGYSIYKHIHPHKTREDFRLRFDGSFSKTIGKTFNQESYNKFRRLEFEAFKQLSVEEDIKKELKILSKTYDLYIVTSNSIKNLDVYFKNNNFTDIFREVLTVETHASKKEKFNTLFQKHGFDESSCVFVTDTVGDIIEAHDLNIACIACTFGYHDEERLKKVKPWKIVSNFSDIRNVIESESFKT